jgi:hypothetical protein
MVQGLFWNELFLINAVPSLPVLHEWKAGCLASGKCPMKKLLKPLLVAVLLFMSGASAEGAAETTGQRVQLPLTIMPVRYELTVKPDTEKLTFDG